MKVTIMKIHHTLTVALLAVALLGGCAAERLYKDGTSQIENGHFEDGLESLRLAMKESPSDNQYRSAFRRQRDAIMSTLLEAAEKARREGRFNDADALVKRSRGIDSNNSRIAPVAENITRDRQLTAQLRDAETLSAAGKWQDAEALLRKITLLNPDLKGASDLRRKIDSQRMAYGTSIPVLKARQERPVTLQFRDTGIRTVLEALSRDTGINFILDKDVRADTRVTIFVQQVRVEDAIDLILIPAQLEKKIISENTIMIYPATPAKQKEYQDLLLRSFYIHNADLKQTMGMLKTMLKVKDVFIDERVNLLVLRDTPDVIRMAEKLIAAHDVPEPEVMLEVEILEISRIRDTNIGARYPDSLQIINGDLINKLNSNITINLKDQEGRSNLLSNPRIRVKSRQKAKVQIGERVPVISSTTTPTTGGTTVALVSQQITYLDIGLKLDVEPIVNMDDTVSIKLALEVNTLGEKVETQTGAVAYRVGTRTTNTILELKDGETQVLSGLIRDDDRRTANRLPVVGEFPILDRLFGTVATNGDKTEIVMSITPRLIRTVKRADVADQESWSGTESAFRTRPLMAQPVPPETKPEARPTAVAPRPVQPFNPSVPAGANPVSPQAPGQPLPPSERMGLPAGAAAVTPAIGAAPLSTSPGVAINPAAAAGAGDSPFGISWLGAASARAGQEISVVLNLRSASPVSSAAFQLQFDPAAVEVLGVQEGLMMRQDNQATTFNQTVDPAGRIYGGVARTSGKPVNGNGALAIIRLRAKPGAKTIALQPLTISPIGADGRVIVLPSIPAFQAAVTQ
jgi:general secretion pathway protein D